MKTGQFYHVYNRANDPNKLFHNANNYSYFLAKYAKYIEPVAETYAYCLLPNHFHFLVRIREKDEILLNAAKDERLKPEKFEQIEEFISKSFSNLFNAYAKAYNKMYDRRGALFMHNFKAKEIDTTDYLRNVIVYIHNNPVKHSIIGRQTNWRWSSLNAIRFGTSAPFSAEKLLHFFESEQHFRQSHELETNMDFLEAME